MIDVRRPAFAAALALALAGCAGGTEGGRIEPQAAFIEDEPRDRTLSEEIREAAAAVRAARETVREAGPAMGDLAAAIGELQTALDGAGAQPLDGPMARAPAAPVASGDTLVSALASELRAATPAMVELMQALRETADALEGGTMTDLPPVTADPPPP